MELFPRHSVVATIGPASFDKGVFSAMVQSGLGVARVNFSHGTHEEHATVVAMVREVAPHVKILGDLCGPKIRIGEIAGKSVDVAAGDICVVTTEQVMGTAERFSISYPGFHREVSVGMKIFLNDGKKVLEILRVEGVDVVCRVIIGGYVKSFAGVNVPQASLSLSALTEKDRRDAKFIAQGGFDMVGLSFVRSAEHVAELRELLAQEGATLPIVSKIETLEAMENLEEIIAASDAAMVARGDLGVEVGFENVPAAQSRIIEACNRLGKPVIVATEMMKSMVDSETPSRAEVSDVANAIREGADAVMLSSETARGSHPVESVAWMRKIVDATEKRP